MKTTPKTPKQSRKTAAKTERTIIQLPLNSHHIRCLKLFTKAPSLKIREILDAYFADLVKLVFACGCRKKSEALVRLNLCRVIVPEEEWRLVSWAYRGTRYFSPCRKDNSNIGTHSRLVEIKEAA